MLQRCAASLSALSVGIAACVLLCLSTSVQRQIFYLHKAPIWWGQKLDSPERFGFLHNQVLPFRIAVSAKVELFAWLITPLALYARPENAFLKTPRQATGTDIAFQLLRQSDSQLVIYFHDNAGTVGQTRRTDAYRMITFGSSNRTHVLAFDYRGFGLSNGNPTESGLIEDARAVVKWATDIAKVPQSRIVLVAQSLGTAVVAGLTEALVRNDPNASLAGTVPCAAF